MSYADWVKQQPASHLEDEYGIKKKVNGYMSAITTRNLKTCVFGFLHWAKDVLERRKADGIYFIPYIMSNQSPLESTFSVFRATGNDKSHNIGKGLDGHNFKGQAKSQTKASKAYGGDHHGEQDLNIYHELKNFDERSGTVH